MPSVFLSYCHDNVSQASKLHNDLSAAGVEVKWDQDFKAGTDFRADIRNAMSEADFVVVCFSKQTEQRDLNGIYPEVRDAIDSLRQRGPTAAYLIPVRLAKCEIPDFSIDGTTTLRHLIYVDVYGPKRKAGVQRLLSTLGAGLAASAIGSATTPAKSRKPEPSGGQSSSDSKSTPIIALSRLPKSHDTGVFEGRDDVLAELDGMWDDALADRDGRARIVSLVAVGGAGKTTVASRWKARLLARETHGVQRYFDWSFYSQGTRDSDGTAAARMAGDATVFIAEALKFFATAAGQVSNQKEHEEILAFADSPAPAWDKGAKLAELVCRHRSLLILDGLEPLQHPPGPQAGELEDDGLRALFAGLAQSGRGLCLVTTRERITDLIPTESLTTPYRPLDHLTDSAGAAVLRAHGVSGPDKELCEASAEVKGHALTLSLMGRFLALAFDPPDIARRDCFKFEEADREFDTRPKPLATRSVSEGPGFPAPEADDPSLTRRVTSGGEPAARAVPLTEVAGRGHAFRVFAAYERWLLSEGREVEVAILRLLGLFDRPATPDCLAALCAEALPGLSEPLVGLGARQWTAALKRLRDLDLIETTDWQPVHVTGYSEEDAKAVWEAGRRGQRKDIGPPQPFTNHQSKIVNQKSLDAHPLLREYFGERLKAEGKGQNEDSGSSFCLHPSAFRAAQLRLYEHLCASVPYWPEGRDGLLPLYQAVAHGCQAGRFEEARAAVYHDRIKRGTAGSHAHYSTNKLGLLGLDLAAVACFFVEPWSRLTSELTPADQAWLLSEAAFSLRALNRLAEAREPMRADMEMMAEQEDWKQASIGAGNLSELELTLGDVPAAESTAAQSVTFADRSDDAFQRMVNRTTHADTLHHAGQREASRTLFAEAEALQAEMQPGYPLLYSVQGYQYCDLLLAPAERASWRKFVNCRLEQAPRSSGISDEDVPEQRSARSSLPGFTEDLADVEHRVAKMFEWRTPGDPMLDIALDHLTLGRVSLLRAVLDSPARHLPQARTALETALTTLRQSNFHYYIPRALLPSAWLHALSGEWDMSVQRLNEAFALATRGGNPDANWQGGMRLHLIDTLLTRVRLFGRQKSEGKRLNHYPWPGRSPQMDLAEAAALIDITGYHRRDEELADLQAVFGE